MSDKLRQFLSAQLRELFDDGERLVSAIDNGYKDYSFMVFPFAKGYEGFLKDLFLKIGAIGEQQYHSDHWRVGKALNPQLEKDRWHMDSVYDRLAQYCGGTSLPETLWSAWKRGRNQVFHYFPQNYKTLSRLEAMEIIGQIKAAMELAIAECKANQ